MAKKFIPKQKLSDGTVEEVHFPSSIIDGLPDTSDMETKTHASQTYQPKGNYITDVSGKLDKTGGTMSGNLAFSGVASSVSSSKGITWTASNNTSAYIKPNTNGTLGFGTTGTSGTEYLIVSDPVDKAFRPASSANNIFTLGTSTYKWKDLYTTSAHIGTIYENGTSLANKYQAKGTYLTSHQDISGKADKGSTNTFSEIQNIIAGSANLLTLKRTAENGGAFVDYQANNTNSTYWRTGMFSTNTFGACVNGSPSVSLEVNTNRQILKDEKYTYTLPDKTGTFALTSDIPSVPTIKNGTTAVSNLTFSVSDGVLTITTT